MSHLKFFLSFVFAATITALGFVSGYYYHKQTSLQTETVSRKLPAEQYYRYTLPDGSEFARGVVQQINPPVILFRTSDELLQLVTSGFTSFKNANYPLSADQTTSKTTLNFLRTKDVADVRFRKKNGYLTVSEILIWNNLGK